MSFDTLKVPELRKAAEDFGVDIEGLKIKSDIVKALDEEGVTWEMYQGLTDEPDPVAPVEKKVAGPVLVVKMIRANPHYEVIANHNKYTFTVEHPYVPMPQDDASALFESEEGFVMATPNEVKNFYK